MRSGRRLKTPDYPDHPVLAEPWTCRIVGLSFLREAGGEDSQLDLILKDPDGVILSLRFTGIRSLVIEDGWPWTDSGLLILDASSAGMEDVGVKVSSLEQGPSIRFWAKDVERVGQ